MPCDNTRRFVGGTVDTIELRVTFRPDFAQKIRIKMFRFFVLSSRVKSHAKAISIHKQESPHGL